jgi:predicted RNA-binding protein YlqC (UPF0109 family)
MYLVLRLGKLIYAIKGVLYHAKKLKMKKRDVDGTDTRKELPR